MKVRTIHLKEGEHVHIRCIGELVVRIGVATDGKERDVLVDTIASDKVGVFDGLFGRRQLNQQLKET